MVSIGTTQVLPAEKVDMYKALSEGLAKLGEKYPEITKRFMSLEESWGLRRKSLLL